MEGELAWDVPLAIWMRKTQVLRQTSGPDEFPLPCPYFCFSLSLATGTWFKLLKWQVEVRKSKGGEANFSANPSPPKTRQVALRAKVTHAATWLCA